MRMGTQDKIITLKMVLSIAISFLMVSLAAIGIFYFRASYIINAEETGDTIPTTGVLPTDWAQKIINYNSNDEYESLSSFSKPIIFGATFADSDVTKTSIDLGNGVYFKTLQNSSLWEDGSTSSNPKSANAYITGCNYLPEDCSNLFRGLTNVPCIQFSGVSTKYTTDMSYMFYNCSSLQSSYDISYSSIYETTYFNPESFDTSRVTDMSGMFAGCSSLTNLNFNTSSFNTSKVKSMYYMFNECVSLTALDLKSFDTSAVESMGYMFGSCVALSNLNLTSFDTSNVKYMHNMFSYCKALESINISSFNTGNVSNMSNMFLQCSSLKSIDLSNFNTQKVTTMDSMFSYSGLRSLDLNHFNTSAVTTMASMFESSKLTHINLKDWDTSNVKNMSRMFYCMSNVGLDLTGWNTSSVTNMASMFAGNYGIQKICVGDGWTTSAVTNSSYMFEGCNNLKGEMGTQHTSSSPSDKTHAFIDRAGAHGYFSNAYKLATGAYINSKIPTDAVRFYFADKNSSIQHLLTSESTPIAVDSSGNITDDIELYKGSDNGVPICVIISAGGITFNEDCSQMFKGLSNLTSIDLSYVINGLCNTTNISEMFSGCSALTTLSTASFATNNITNMSGLFKDCTSLTSLDVSNFITNKTTDMSYMFDGLSQFTEINISNFNTENVTNMSHMFNGCSGLTAIDVRNFVTDKVENFSYMFAGLKKVEEINTSNFITDSATNMAGMFKNCEKVYFFNISQFNTENVADMSYMFYECLQVTTIPVENFNMSNVLDISHMFHSSWQISELNVSGWDASKIENMSYAFANIHIDLTTIDMRTWNATNVKYMDGMFFHTDGIKILDFSSFDIANLISATDMVDCYNIQHIYMPYCSVEKEITFCTLPGTWTSFQTGTTYTDLAITYDYLSYYDDTTFVESHFVQGSSINVFLNNYWVNCLDLASAETIQSILFLETKNATMLDDEYTYLMTSSWIDRWQSIYPMGKIDSSTGLWDIVIHSQYSIIASSDASGMFANMTNLKEINFANFRVTNLTSNIGGMFYNCTSLKHLDLNHWDLTGLEGAYSLTYNTYTSSVFDPFYNSNAYYNEYVGLFENCTSLETLHIEDWDTSAMINPYTMFRNCSSLKSLDLNKWDTSNFDHISGMFYGCSSLTELKISNWDTSNVRFTNSSGSVIYYSSKIPTDDGNWRVEISHSRAYATGGVFEGCSSLKNIDIANWDTSNMNSTAYMFKDCSSLESIDLSNWNVSSVYAVAFWSDLYHQWYLQLNSNQFGDTAGGSMLSMFEGCSSLKNINLNGWNMIATRSINRMFKNCTSLESINLNSWENMDDLFQAVEVFYGCINLKDVNIGEWNISQLQTTSRMFEGCANLTSINLDNWQTSNLLVASGMFKDCAKLQEIDVNHFDTSSLVYTGWWDIDLSYDDMIIPTGGMFENCVSLTSIDLSNWNTEYLQDAPAMFAGCSSLQSLDLSNWNTKRLNIASEMFSGCTSLAQIIFGSGWQCNTLSRTSSMFKNCSSLTTLFSEGFSTTNLLTHTSEMFYGCSNLKVLDLSGFDLSGLEHYPDMFAGLTSLKGLYTPHASNDTLTAGINAPWIHTSSNSVYPYATINIYTLSTKNDDGTITKSLLTINQLPTNWCSLLGLSKNQVGTIAVTQRTAPLGSEYTDPIILYDSIYGVNGSYTYNETTKLYDVLIYSEILITVPIDASNIFADFENLTTLTLNNLHISKVTTNVSNAFANNPKLASLDLSNSDLSGVTTSSGMLNNLNSLNTFYVPYKQASSNIVGNIQAPWSKMEIDEEQSDETNIVYKQTKNLNYATISSETENSLLVSISVPENWLDLLGLTKEQIKSIKFTSNTTPTYAGVTGSYNIKLADVGLYDYYIGYKPIGVSGLYDVAFDCYYSIYAPINAEGLFKDFTKLTSIDLSNLSFGYTKNFKSLFENCSSLTSIDLSGIKVSTTNYTNFTDFLKGTTSLLTIVSPKLESTYEDVPSVPVIEINNGRKYNSYSVAPSHSSWDRSNNNGNIVQFKQYSFSFYGECTNDGDKGWFITTLTASAYTITYKDKNGEPFSGIFDGTYPTEFNSSSGTITLPTPTRALYIFNGWFRDSNCMYGQIAEFDGTSITQDLVVYANWTPNFNTITWKNWNGDILYSTMVEIGSTPSYTGTTPTRQEDAQYTYTFSGWDPAISQVTDVGETTYTATFTGTLRKYDVYWVVDGTTVETYSNIEYGTVVTYTGATPTKPATAQYTYTFSHWDPNPSSGITGDTTYNAIFTSTTNKYTITWVDGDGNTLQSSKVEYGTTPTYSGAAPTKTATAQYSYNWTGNWDKEITTVTGDATYTATFNPTLRSYTITWKNEDGSTLETDSNVSYGATPEYNGSTPTKAGNAQYSYTFNGWSPAISSVTGNATYTAQFTQSTNKYTITWINEDGSPLETDSNVSYGATPEYNGSTPTKTGNAQYSYTFNGWSPAVSSVTGDTIYTAQFTQSTNKYTVTWNNWDGTTLETDSNVSYGSTPEYNGSTPTKTGDAQYSYTFNGWSPAVSSVTGNITYTAQFIQSTNEYTITWKNGNGSIIKTESLDYGSTPSYSGATPTKTATAKYSYTFNNTWSPNIINVVADATYTAQFDQTINKYTITWKMTNSDGSEIILQSSEVEYDAMPTYNGETPQKTRTAQYTFTFSKWTPEVSIVTGHKTYIAEFTSSVNQYTITWLNDDDSIIDTTTVAYGDTPSHADPTKENTAQYSYSFSGWSPAIAIVTGDATYKATFTSTVNKYIITWKDGNGSTIKTESLDYGSTPSYSGATPTKTATAKYSYTFNNTWSPNIINVVADATYTAQFDQTINKYTITWKMTDSDGSEIILQSSEVEYDAMPTYNRDTPQKTRTAQYTFTFSKWTPEVSIVTGHKTYIAEFTETINTYTVTWKNYQLATLETDTNVQYGTTPTYDGETPRKPSDAEYKYEFKGWDPTVSSVEGDVTYVAQFDSIANSYTITWKNWDGTTLETDKNVPYGATPSYDGDDPYRASTARYTYTWTGGWDKELSAVTGNTTYTATYTSTVNKYTITWKNENGDILQTDEDVEYGSEVKYNGEPPTKDATAQFTYEFEGWSPEVTPVRADATYTATYTATINKYTITWKNEDGTTLEIDEYVEYGTRPVYNGETPTKEADADVTYSFKGWTPEISNVSGDATYTATYTTAEAVYQIIWKDEDNTTILETDNNVPYGALPEFNKADPTKASTDEFEYTFNGWSPAVETVKGNAVYVATYKATRRSYLITWINDDDNQTQLLAEEVEYGTTPTYNGATPTKNATAQFYYTFAGWTPEITAVTGTATYTATYTETVNKYTVTWKNEDGFTLETDENVEFGTMPSYDGETPTKQADDQYTYTFKEWSPAIVAVSGNVTYTATYNNTTNIYTITWIVQVSDSETETETTEVEYGVLPVYPKGTPVRENTAEYTYEFSNWSPELSSAVKDTTYTAVFTSTKNTYLITWLNDNGSLIAEERLEYGLTPYRENPTKEADAQYTYTFAGWSPTIVPVTGDANYTATYTTTVNKYTITWLDGNNEIIKSDTLEYGEIPEYSGETPTKIATAQYTYTFNHTWTPEISLVTGDATYTAQFDSTINNYTITWLDDDGNIIDTTTVAYGETPTHTDPTKQATQEYTYEFSGWSPSVVPVTGVATYQATYTATKNKYLITWIIDGLPETTEVEYGATPSHDNPIKEADVEFTYEFIGWTPTIVPVTENATYTAQFDSLLNKYIITWLDDDGTTILKTTEVEYGTMPVYGENPIKASTIDTCYTFAGWTPTLTEVTGNTSYIATYTASVRKYVITWIIDGLTETTEVEYGATPSHDNPTKEADVQYTYSFKEWSPAITEVTGPATYTAIFDSITNKYTITWLNEDDSELLTEQVAYGTIPSYSGDTPTKQADAQYTYTFDTWTPSIVTVTGDASYTATYSLTINVYTVTWKNGETTLATESYEYGQIPEYKGQTPEKASTAEKVYSFTGWNPSISSVTENAEYVALFTESARTYTVTWNNYDGNTLATTEVAYGLLPSYTGETPTRQETAETTYQFKGWYPALSAVQGPTTYTATFNEETRKYTITWLQDDNSIIKTEEVEYGTLPYCSNPSKEATAEFKYEFSGWSPTVQIVTGDAEYKATYTSQTRSYTVIWKNYDGTPLQEDIVNYGVKPAYTGTTPIKPNTAEFSYLFSGWSPEVGEITGETIYIAQFTETKKHYTISWKNEDGYDIYEPQSVAYGETPIAPGTPTKDADEQYTYEFNKWSPDIVPVSGNAEYYATFTATLRKYTITWKNGDDILEEKDWNYGTTPSYDGPNPTKDADEQYTYEFDKWSPDIVSVSSDAEYYATFTATLRKYTITWTDENGIVLETDTDVEYGTLPEYNGIKPTKEADEQYTYDFEKWSPEVSEVTGDMTYVTVFKEIINVYTVDWRNYDGNSLQIHTVAYGEIPVFTKENPTRPADDQYTYTFSGWIPEVGPVKGITVYIANYTTTVNTYTVTWKLEDGTVLETDTDVAYGTIPEYNGISPVKEKDHKFTYTFSGWDKPTSNGITGDTTFIAQFTDTLNVYTITASIDQNGTIFPGSTNVTYGSNQQFIFTPNTGYVISKVFIDDVEQDVDGNSYTFTNVTENHSIRVECEKIKFIITLEIKQNGRLIATEEFVVEYDEDIQIDLSKYYDDAKLVRILVNNKEFKRNKIINLENVIANIDIDALYVEEEDFAILPIILISSGLGLIILISISIVLIKKHNKARMNKAKEKDIREKMNILLDQDKEKKLKEKQAKKRNKK